MTNACVTFWEGDELGPVERACMRSVLRQGHPLSLYCYRQPAGVPEGVETRDASEILPPDRLFLHCGKSVAPFSDWFRYELQKRALGTWTDADVYLLAPLDTERSHLFGEEAPGRINNAVLRLPPGSPLLPPLLRIFEARTTPPWLPWRHYLPTRLRELTTGEIDLSRLPWGSTGPIALTAVARQFGVDGEACPPEVLNPVSWREAAWVRDPAIRLDDVITDRTVAIHLWNECIKGFKNQAAPHGSFLERLQWEGA